MQIAPALPPLLTVDFCLRQWHSSTPRKLLHVHVPSCQDTAHTELHRRPRVAVRKGLVHAAVHLLTIHYTSLQCTKNPVSDPTDTIPCVAAERGDTHQCRALPVRSLWRHHTGSWLVTRCIHRTSHLTGTRRTFHTTNLQLTAGRINLQNALSGQTPTVGFLKYPPPCRTGGRVSRTATGNAVPAGTWVHPCPGKSPHGRLQLAPAAR